MSAQYGLPIDMASKRGGLAVIAKALNEGDLARAQIATVLLGIPDPPSLSKGPPSRQEMIKLASDLRWSRLLKADWDPDQHPRWPAGAPDSQGGQFAPKGTDSASDQSTGGVAEARQPPADARGVGILAHQQRHSSDASSNIRSVSQSNNEGDGKSQNVPAAEDLGVYASYRHYVGGARLASASIPMDGLPIPTANPADWAKIRWLANGALRLGSGQIIVAATLLAATTDYREKARVTDAISRFDLDPTSAADVLAARAYVWARHWAPGSFDVPWEDPQLESVSQSIMAVELARPGTLYLATQGDEQSRRYMRAAAEAGMQSAAISESRPRPENLPPALQTTISGARDALNLQTNDQLRAHHLIPANVWEKVAYLAALASQAGWQPDSEENLISLPANQQTQAKLAARDGFILPIHNTSHPNYDKMALVVILLGAEKFGKETPTPAEARVILEAAADEMGARSQLAHGCPSCVEVTRENVMDVHALAAGRYRSAKIE